MNATTGVDDLAEVDDLVGAAEALHEETGRAVTVVRRWRRRRTRGESWTALVRSSAGQALLGIAAGVARSSAELVGRLRALVVRQLSGEGWTRRQIAELVGVSHQRVSKIAQPATSREPARPRSGA